MRRQPILSLANTSKDKKGALRERERERERDVALGRSAIIDSGVTNGEDASSHGSAYYTYVDPAYANLGRSEVWVGCSHLI